MPLSKEQQKDLRDLNEYFKRIERLAEEHNIDLDVFMSEYRDDGYAVYATEKVSLQDKATKRKKVFEKAGKEKSDKSSVLKNR
ncbi:MAG TPA: hypothetical protein PLU53_07790 [Bacteroidia bacterium]|nr:hypothetical protein [Bacteroidia bacterium]